MGYRLSKIVTRTGDDGSTGLGNGQRCPKHALRIEAIGSIDELNSTVGLLLCEDLPHTEQEALTQIQHHLFNCGGELSIPGSQLMNDDHVLWLEAHIARMNETLSPLAEFILPGGTKASAQAHRARTVCRRAERVLCALADTEPVSAATMRYFNRLSDFLFVLSRWLNHLAGVSDVLWRQQK
jgi:cob(I)alamin adenosyltransferase